MMLLPSADAIVQPVKLVRQKFLFYPIEAPASFFMEAPAPIFQELVTNGGKRKQDPKEEHVPPEGMEPMFDVPPTT